MAGMELKDLGVRKDLHVIPVAAGVAVPAPVGDGWHEAEDAIDGLCRCVGVAKVPYDICKPMS